jgi:hypothetical protein
VFERYTQNNRILLRVYAVEPVYGRLALINSEDKPTYRECLATCTVNFPLPEYNLPEGYVFIKSWSENEGVLECLVHEGVVAKPVATVPTGFVVAHVCKLLMPVPEAATA